MFKILKTSHASVYCSVYCDAWNEHIFSSSDGLFSSGGAFYSGEVVDLLPSGKCIPSIGENPYGIVDSFQFGGPSRGLWIWKGIFEAQIDINPAFHWLYRPGDPLYVYNGILHSLPPFVNYKKVQVGTVISQPTGQNPFLEFEWNVLSEPQVKSSTKGVTCSKCLEFNEYLDVPSEKDGIHVCYRCKH